MSQATTNSSVAQQILEQVARLDRNEQLRVLNFANALAESKSLGEPGSHLLEFVGSIPPRDLKEIEEAIQQGCEKVDLNGW